MTTPIEFLWNGPPDASTTVVLAHGAGAPMDSPFMHRLAEGIAAAGLRAGRFEFPYMAERRRTGGRRGPNPAKTLLATWRQAAAEAGPAEQLVIGGKSMGGRIASMVADELGVRGLVCLGYPFHPPGKPDKLRTAHLQTIETPTLIIQGERDSFGKRAEIPDFGLDPRIEFLWLEDGDHSFKPRVKSGFTEAQHIETAIAAVVRFARGET